jgi:hypothetical protein
MTKVFRVENKDGKGPYVNNNNQSWCKDNMRHRNINHPDPLQDGIFESEAEHNYDYVCGFDDLYKLYDWFSNTELAALYALGFDIMTYETNDIIYGVSGTQIMFKKELKT